MLVLAAFFASLAFAADVPDAWVKGLWLKATGLPKGTHLEDEAILWGDALLECGS